VIGNPAINGKLRQVGSWAVPIVGQLPKHSAVLQTICEVLKQVFNIPNVIPVEWLVKNGISCWILIILIILRILGSIIFELIIHQPGFEHCPGDMSTPD
jgi:hypothetical protein